MPYQKYYEFLKNELNKGPFLEEDYLFFAKHNLALYFYERACSAMQVDSIGQQNLLIYKLDYKKTVCELRSIGKAFDENKICYLSVKGLSISETYPEPFTRMMGDHDVLVRPEDFEKAKDTLAKLGYSDELNISTYKDVSMHKKGAKPIELHHALFNPEIEPYAERFTENLWENPVRIELAGGTFSVPRPEIHFRYIALHMMKHLKGSGFGLKSLLDFKYFSMFHRIDLEKQFEFFKGIGYGEFYRAIVTLCHYEIGMPVESANWLFEREAVVVQILAEFIAEGGEFGKNSEKHRITKHFEKYHDSAVGKSNAKILLIALFPPKDFISEQYVYVVDRQWLLPIAWVHRLFKMGVSKKIRLKEKLFFLTRDELFVSEKDYMMKTLGLKKEE